MSVSFETSRLTHWATQQFFGPGFWIGFRIHVILMESWIRKQPMQEE
jgi:hypothetical protein